MSPGCEHCYAEGIAVRFSGFKTLNAAIRMGRGPAAFEGFAKIVNGHPSWTGKVELIESKLTEPLYWKKPQRIFVNSMSDLFHEALPDKAIDRVFAVMALCPQHTFQVLTKRAGRMRLYCEGAAGRIGDEIMKLRTDKKPVGQRRRKVDWVIVGGESGPGARRFDLEWMQSVVEQCKTAGTPIFCKQIGSNPFWAGYPLGRAQVGDRKGGKMSEWPTWAQVRQFPTCTSARAESRPLARSAQ